MKSQFSTTSTPARTMRLVAVPPMVVVPKSTVTYFLQGLVFIEKSGFVAVRPGSLRAVVVDPIANHRERPFGYWSPVTSELSSTLPCPMLSGKGTLTHLYFRKSTGVQFAQYCFADVHGVYTLGLHTKNANKLDAKSHNGIGKSHVGLSIPGGSNRQDWISLT